MFSRLDKKILSLQNSYKILISSPTAKNAFWPQWCPLKMTQEFVTFLFCYKKIRTIEASTMILSIGRQSISFNAILFIFSIPKFLLVCIYISVYIKFYVKLFYLLNCKHCIEQKYIISCIGKVGLNTKTYCSKKMFS